MPHIVVADDDTIMLGLITTVMDFEGITVHTVTRPEDVIPMLKETEPPLILMDYHLAGGTSIDVLRSIKSDDDLKHITVFVTSGMDREIECMRAGADAFILKPFRPAELLSKIMEALNA